MGLKALLVGILAVTGIAAASAQDSRGPRCTIGDVEQRRLLALSFEEFDQRADSGWRPYLDAGCTGAAADIVEAYIDRYPDRAAAHPVLHFHAGQLRAFLGETDAAVAQMKRAVTANDAAARGHGADWSQYVSATIAFLEQDKAALEAARDALSGDRETQSPSETKAQSGSRDTRWAPPPPPAPRDRRQGTPPSQFLPQVEAMLACFGQPYAIAYGRCIVQ